jgi:hypothetical protein
MDMGKVEDWLSAVPSKATRKTCKAGLKKFEIFYGNGVETLIGKSGEESGKIVDKFYVWLKEPIHIINGKPLPRKVKHQFRF